MEACANCGHYRDDRFCPRCGQDDRDYTRSLWRLVGDVIKETFEVDGRLPRTLRPMFLRPGQLAVEFSRNRRASYVSPVRSYLFASILFFFVLAVTANPGSGPDMPPDQVTEEQEARGRILVEKAGAVVDVLRDPRSAARLLDNLPLAMFVTLPAYALLLKMFFYSSRRYYTEHLVFAMHLHTFSFLVYTVIMVMLNTGHLSEFLGGTLKWAALALFLWVVAYSYLALRRYYRNGLFVTAIKWFVLGCCYAALLIPGLLLSVAATIWL